MGHFGRADVRFQHHRLLGNIYIATSCSIVYKLCDYTDQNAIITVISVSICASLRQPGHIATHYTQCNNSIGAWGEPKQAPQL
jgi:hypothetical protein